jgi:hypothetical protein
MSVAGQPTATVLAGACVGIGAPGGEAPLEQSHPFGDLALPDQCNPRTDGDEDLGDEGQAVFATRSIGLLDTLPSLKRAKHKL